MGLGKSLAILNLQKKKASKAHPMVKIQARSLGTSWNVEGKFRAVMRKDFQKLELAKKINK